MINVTFDLRRSVPRAKPRHVEPATQTDRVDEDDENLIDISPNPNSDKRKKVVLDAASGRGALVDVFI